MTDINNSVYHLTSIMQQVAWSSTPEPGTFTSYLGNLSPYEKKIIHWAEGSQKIQIPLLFVAPLKVINGVWTRSDHEKAGVFDDHLSKSISLII